MNNTFNGFHYKKDYSEINIRIIPKDIYFEWCKNFKDSRKLKIISNINPDLKVCFPVVETDSTGKISEVILLVNKDDKFCLSCLYGFLPDGSYNILDEFNIIKDEFYYIAFALSFYKFDKYKKQKRKNISLFVPQEYAHIYSYIKAHYWVRDLINTPAEDMGPEELASELKRLSIHFSATYQELIGTDLLRGNYPAIHAVGRASNRQPRLVELTWGNKEDPKLSLVGKGVCFDTGGLDIKPASGMLIMHKDMGGAAHVLALAYLIMSSKLPVYLNVVIPCVENLINHDAFKPSDIINMRNGTSVQVKNTDAEGRLILADALFKVDSESSDLIIDFATLTGAMRVALGTDIPGFFSNNQQIARDLQEISIQSNDLVWNMPLYQGYESHIQGDISDYSNVPSHGYGGAISAALFLNKFIGQTDWIHFDLMAWNLSEKPGRPTGGEAMGLLATMKYLQQRYFKNK